MPGVNAEARTPLFTSFAEAWAWFGGTPALEPLADQRARLLRGRAQLIAFQARIEAQGPPGELIAAVQEVLAQVDGLALLPSELLHVSVLGAGFQVIARKRADEVLRQEVPALAERAARALAAIAACAGELGPVNVFPDAVVLEVQAPVFAEARRALASVVAHDAFAISDAHYLPHCTVAMFAEPAAALAPLRAALGPLRALAPVPFAIDALELVRWWFTGLDVTEPPELDVIRRYRLRA
jgi:2'-5' RNA ligase